MPEESARPSPASRSPQKTANAPSAGTGTMISAPSSFKRRGTKADPPSPEPAHRTQVKAIAFMALSLSFGLNEEHLGEGLLRSPKGERDAPIPGFADLGV